MISNHKLVAKFTSIEESCLDADVLLPDASLLLLHVDLLLCFLSVSFSPSEATFVLGYGNATC